MRNIQPLTIWKDGQNTQASILKMQINFDNLDNHAIFQYELCDNQEKTLVLSTVTISGTDYINWSNGGNSNDEAYQYVSSSLNLVLV